MTKLGDQQLGVIAAKPESTALTPFKKILESDGKTNLVGKDGDTASAKVGDYVKYELSTVVPNTVGYPEDGFRFYLTDTMDESLSYVNDEAHPTTVKVNGKTLTQCTESESNCTGDYYRSTQASLGGDPGTNVFFYLDKYVYKASQDIDQVGKPVTVTYYAKINDKAVKAPQSNDNTVSLDISKFSGWGTDVIKGNTVKVYTYDTAFTKV